MTEQDEELLVRFMAGDTQDMDLHEHAGEVLRAEIKRLRSAERDGILADAAAEAPVVKPKRPRKKAVGYRESSAPTPADGYELEILSLAYNVSHTQCTVEFKAHGAPNFSYSAVRGGPILRAVISLVVSTSRRLSSGGGSALATRDPSFVAGDWGTALEGPSAVGVPERPSDDAIEKACTASLQRHLIEARDENARVGFREEQEKFVGKKFTVRM